jgi:F-type H+-transporting ATPase subunit b
VRNSLKSAVGRHRPRLSRPAIAPSPSNVALGFGLTAASTLIASSAFASDKLELIPDYMRTMPILIIGFVLLVFPLNQLIFKPIFRALDERIARIQGARDRSSQLQHAADEVLERYEAAIREARGESEVARQRQLATAREEQVLLTTQARTAADGELERARAELSGAIDEARSSLRASAEDLAQTAAEQVLGRALS